MSKTVNQETKATVNTEGQQTEEQSSSFTQEDVDRIVKERLERERAKYADYESMKEKAAKYDEVEEASKTELQKATEKVTKLQKELDSIKTAEKVRNIRAEVAKETNVPVDLLTGETKEDCEAQAKAILSFAKPDTYPNVKDGGEVRNTGGKKTRDQFADFLNQF